MASRTCLVNEKIRCKLFNIPFRASIFKVHLERIKTEMDKEAIAKKMASLTSGFSGVCEICYSLYDSAYIVMFCILKYELLFRSSELNGQVTLYDHN